MEISKIRESISVLPRASNGKLLRVPNELRGEIIRASNGFDGRREDFAKEVGLSYATMVGWEEGPVKKEAKPERSFRRVEIKTESSEKGFTVEGPNGLRVLGLSFKQIAILFKEVRGEF